VNTESLEKPQWLPLSVTGMARGGWVKGSHGHCQGRSEKKTWFSFWILVNPECEA
jgi:hypothetical protein